MATRRFAQWSATGALLLLAACPNLATPPLDNPFDPDAPSPQFTAVADQGVVISWDVRPFTSSPIFQGARIELLRQVSLIQCDPAGQTVSPCGLPVLVASNDPATAPNPSIKDATLSVPWGPRAITYTLQLNDAEGGAHVLGQITPQALVGDDIDGDSITQGDCDDANPDVGLCDPNATCAETRGIWNCQCNAGYLGDGATCGLSCDTDNGGCDPHATCSNVAGQPHCTCDRGFLGDGTTCACATGGYTVCADGACRDTQSDPDNCGSCGFTCNLFEAQSACVEGACAVTACDPGYGNCDGDSANGCEATLNSDPLNCNGCGNACAFPNAVPVCANGTCGVAACDPGYGDCDNVPSNGCETDTNTDVENCGGCDQPCTVRNGTGACAQGVCEVASCSGTYADCDNDPTTGCETNLATDPESCGQCGHVCPAGSGTAVCTDALCGVAQ